MRTLSPCFHQGIMFGSNSDSTRQRTNTTNTSSKLKSNGTSFTTTIHNNSNEKSPTENIDINTTNAIYGGYCFIFTTLWIILWHFIPESGFGSFCHLLLLFMTLYLFVFYRSCKTVYKSLGEPIGHSSLREMAFFWPFFKDCAIMALCACCESFVVYLISYMNPNKFNKREPELYDTFRALLNCLLFNNNRKLKTLWFDIICKYVIPGSAFTFVEWAVILMIGQGISPHVGAFRLGSKYCRCIGIVRIIRVLCFIGTVLPSAHNYGGLKGTCHQRRMTDYFTIDVVPKLWKATDGRFHWSDEPINWKYALTNHGGGGCNDLVFSGHCSIIFVTLCLYYELFIITKRYFAKLMNQHIDKLKSIGINNNNNNNNNSGREEAEAEALVKVIEIGKRFDRILLGMKLSVGYVFFLGILSCIKMITEKHHYTVDVVVAFFITVPVWYIIGSKNIATRDAKIIGRKDDLQNSISNSNSTVIEKKRKEKKGKEKTGSKDSGGFDINFENLSIIWDEKLNDELNDPWWVVNVTDYPSYIEWINKQRYFENLNWISNKITRIKFFNFTDHRKEQPFWKNPGFIALVLLGIPMLFVFGILLAVS